VTVKEIYHNKWVRFSFWAVLYVLWVIWLQNFWWLIGLAVVFDIFITKKVKWAFWKKNYKEGEKPNILLDWLDAIIFAVIVVTFINIFFIQSFKIPSSSMESSLMTGDYLFVSKVAYGPKMPERPLSIPFMHNVIPGTLKKSYSDAIKFDYNRLKGLKDVQRDDYVVFAFPHGDTVLTKAPTDDYYTHVRFTSREYTVSTFGPLIDRPVDKIDHYVKRCVAIAGDSLCVRDGWVYVNGEAQKTYKGIQNTYSVVTNGSPVNSVTLNKIGFNTSEIWYDPAMPGYPALPLTEDKLKSVQALSNVVSVTANVDVFASDRSESELMLFPFTSTGWTRDNYGPIWIPKAGVTVSLDENNIALYRRIIEVYEHNTFEVAPDGGFIINGEPTSEYTFKMDYYFMMGDNRHNSLDSRYWGFVPETHIVGRPAFIWFSSDSGKPFPKNIRWNRMMRFVNHYKLCE